MIDWYREDSSCPLWLQFIVNNKKAWGHFVAFFIEIFQNEAAERIMEARGKWGITNCFRVKKNICLTSQMIHASKEHNIKVNSDYLSKPFSGGVE